MTSGDGAADGQPASRLAARLVHDVGKYIARTARNVRGQAWTPELVAMLCRDLFELTGGRASAVFEDLAKRIEARTGTQPALSRVRGLLAQQGDQLPRPDLRRQRPAASDAGRISGARCRGGGSGGVRSLARRPGQVSASERRSGTETLRPLA